MSKGPRRALVVITVEDSFDRLMRKNAIISTMIVDEMISKRFLFMVLSLIIELASINKNYACN